MAIEDPDDDLVAAVGRLDDAAVSTFLERYDGLIRASVTQGGYFIEDARDEEQLQNDVRRAAIEGIGKWNPSKARISTWIYGIARNVVNGFLRVQAEGRKSGRYSEEVGPDELDVAAAQRDADPEDPAEPVDPYDTIDPDSWCSDVGSPAPLPPMLAAFFAVADQLSAADRVTLDHLLGGGPHRELADRLGISEDTAKVRVHRLKQRLKAGIIGKSDPAPS